MKKLSLMYYPILITCSVLITSCVNKPKTIPIEKPIFEIVKRNNSDLLKPKKIYFNEDQIPANDLHYYYSYINHTIPGTNTPSECDGDYREIILKLRLDHTFELKDLRGRLNILSIEEKEGKWGLIGESYLNLSIDSVKIHILNHTTINRYPSSKKEKYLIINDNINYDENIQLQSSNPINKD